MMRATIDSATLMLVFSQCSSAGRTCESTADITSGLFRRSLVWPWNCGSCDEDAEHADQAFADVLGRERHAFRREVVRLDEVAHRLAEAGAEAVLVRAARCRRDAVDVAAHVLVGRLRPLQRDIEPRCRSRRFPREANGASCTGTRRPLGEDLLQVVGRGPRCAGRRRFSAVASSSKTIFTPLCR